MAERAPEDSESARRRTFLQHFHSFDANVRFPAPYTQFAGKPLMQAAGNGWRYDGLGYRNDVHADARPPSESLRVFVVGDSTMVEGQVFADTVPDAWRRCSNGSMARAPACTISARSRCASTR